MPVVWSLLTLLIGVLALATIPVEVACRVEVRQGQRDARGTLYWLLGLVQLPLGKRKAQGRAVQERRKRARRRHAKRTGVRRMIAALRVEGFSWRLLRLIQDLLRRIEIRELNVEAYLGLDDPADTGKLWAVIGPVAAIMFSPTAHIALAPQFTTRVFALDGRARIRVIPIRLLSVILVFILTPCTLRALHAMKGAAR